MMGDRNGNTTPLRFPIDVTDGWPPVAVETLPFERRGDEYEALAAPLFVRELSVGDRISAKVSGDGSVATWRHTYRSDRTTIWLLRLQRTDQIEITLSDLRAINCNTVGLGSAGTYSVDVPASVPWLSLT
jgi:hypothetical protein